MAAKAAIAASIQGDRLFDEMHGLWEGWCFDPPDSYRNLLKNTGREHLIKKVALERCRRRARIRGREIRQKMLLLYGKTRVSLSDSAKRQSKRSPSKRRLARAMTLPQVETLLAAPSQAVGPEERTVVVPAFASPVPAAGPPPFATPVPVAGPPPSVIPMSAVGPSAPPDTLFAGGLCPADPPLRVTPMTAPATLSPGPVVPPTVELAAPPAAVASLPVSIPVARWPVMPILELSEEELPGLSLAFFDWSPDPEFGEFLTGWQL